MPSVSPVGISSGCSMTFVQASARSWWMLVRIFNQKLGTWSFLGDLLSLLLLIADIVSLADIAPHVWLFRPSYRASYPLSHSELLIKRCFSHSCMLLQIKASASWTNGEIFTVIVFQPNSLELFCIGFKDPLLPEEIISLLKLTYSLNFCFDLLLQLFPHNWYFCCILDIIQLFKLFFFFFPPT